MHRHKLNIIRSVLKCNLLRTIFNLDKQSNDVSERSAAITDYIQSALNQYSDDYFYSVRINFEFK